MAGPVAGPKVSSTLLRMLARQSARPLERHVSDGQLLQSNRAVLLGRVTRGKRGAATLVEPDDNSVAQLYEAYQLRKAAVREMGAIASKAYEPHRLVNQPIGYKNLTLELLLASQAHLGHATSLWNPANQRYIFGVRQGIHVISLDITAAHLRRACRVVSGITRRAGLVLFVGTRSEQSRIVVKAAELAGGCHLFERWIPGSITNGQQILGDCRVMLVDPQNNEVSEHQELLTEHPALKPDLVVCLNPIENYVLLHECAMNSIPTIGIIDTDANPSWVTYPIPANDDSLRCVALIAGMLGRAGEEGQAQRRADLERGVQLPRQELASFLARDLQESRKKNQQQSRNTSTTR